MTTARKGVDIADDYYEANHALGQVKALVFVGQEAYTSSDDEWIYDFLGVIGEKVEVARVFLQDNEDRWEISKKMEDLHEEVESLVVKMEKMKHEQEEGK